MGSSAKNGLDTRLKAARRRRGLNREALAFHSGVSWSAIAQSRRADARTCVPAPCERSRGR